MWVLRDYKSKLPLKDEGIGTPWAQSKGFVQSQGPQSPNTIAWLEITHEFPYLRVAGSI